MGFGEKRRKESRIQALREYVKISEAIELLQERRTALISAAITGKINVREAASQETEAVEEMI